MPRRSSVIRGLISFLLPVLLIGGAVGWFFVELQPVEAHAERTVDITIPEKTGTRAIAKQLQDAGLIRNQYAFVAAVVLAGIGKDLKAGEYTLSPGDSATEIARMLSKDPKPKEVELTIPEGWTLKQIGDYIEKQGIGTSQGFVTAASVHDSRNLFPNESFDFLSGKPPSSTLEGYLFPDTYRVFPDATSTDVIQKMLTNFGVKLTPTLRSQVSASGHTLHEIVTMASIIEEEVRTDTDRALVADIFWRRIKNGMPLQSDATVSYVTGKGNQALSIADTEVSSPYNTYQHTGLPPGPIDNPGLASIMAALHPQANTNVYFLTDKSGQVYYAETYEQHLANKQKYL